VLNHNNQKSKFRISPLIAAAVVATMGLGGVLLAPKAQATNFTAAMVRFDHLTATTATTGRVCIKPTTSMLSGDKVILNIPTTAATDYSVGLAATWTTNTTFESGFTFNGTAVTGLPIASNVASNVTGKVVTFTTNGALTAGTSYCFNWTNSAALTTSSAGAAVSVFGYVKTQSTSGSVDRDLNYWGTTIISGETVTVSAIVAPVFTMALNGSTDTFATNLSSASVNTSNGGRTIQVDTNALNGWIVWAKGTNFKTVTDTGTSPANRHGALTSVTAGGYAISNNTTNALATPTAAHAFTFGTEDYGLAVTLNTDGAGGGSPAMNAVYDGTTAGTGGVIDPTQYRPIASSTGTATGDKINILMLATITNSTPPGADYTDTLTYVGAGQF
jgi:hypothetical protein